MRTIIFIIISLVTLSIGASKDELYFKGGSEDFGIDLAHPEQGKIKLPVGSANVSGIIELNGTIYGITKPQYQGRNPIVFSFSLQKNLTTGFTTLPSQPGKTVSPAYGIIADSTQAFCATYGKDSDGKLFSVKTAGANPEIKELGSPLKGEGIFCIAISNNRKTIYGILTPSNTFFTYNITASTFKIIKGAEIDSSSKSNAVSMHSGENVHLCKSLISDNSGRVYGSTGMGRIFRFDPATESIAILKAELPYIQFRKATNRVESWARTADGTIYGGTSIDGILFKLNPENGTVTNLGKPTHAGNITSLIVDGSALFGICGTDPEYSHLFKYDAENGGFEDLGILRFKNTLINARHMSYSIASMIKLTDGRIIFAEGDLLPNLIFWKK
ncbi:MAG: PQQ-like beta-propeller repeat protein [Fibrobacteres bacterium]|nr:PQQ-like beta-propeller repeat protein [Fibrobacterota bacterium]